jgi:hypothetical protein
MSKYRDAQSWVEVQHQALQGWRELSEDDCELLRTIKHVREMRVRNHRSRVRRERQLDQRETEH